MNRTLIVTGLVLLSATACSRSTTSEPAPAEPPPAAPPEARPEVRVQVPAEIPMEVSAEGSTEAPPPVPTDHRLRLGIDGDPGYTETELTPEELAAENAAAAKEPSYPVEPTEPSQAQQANEDSEEVVEGSSDPYYMEERRAPVIRHEVRREDEVREGVEEEHLGEARPVERGRR